MFVISAGASDYFRFRSLSVSLSLFGSRNRIPFNQSISWFNCVAQRHTMVYVWGTLVCMSDINLSE